MLPTILENKVGHAGSPAVAENAGGFGSFYLGSMPNSPLDGEVFTHNGDPIDFTKLQISGGGSGSPERGGSQSSTWKSLGILLVSSDPSWLPWEPRLLMLMDNYMFECVPDASRIIGFAMLNHAEISSVLLRKLPKDRKTASSDPAASSQILAIQLSYLTESKATANLRRVWIRCPSFQSTADLQDELMKAAEMGLDEIYDFRTANNEDALLSAGE